MIQVLCKDLVAGENFYLLIHVGPTGQLPPAVWIDKDLYLQWSNQYHDSTIYVKTPTYQRP